MSHCSDYTQKVKGFINSLEDDDVGQGKIDSLQPSSIKPKPDRPDATQPRDPGEPAEETEWGPLANQREMREYSPNTEVACDGKDCPYRTATLPGTRGRRGSYFGAEDLNASNTVEPENLNKEGLIAEEKKEKDLLRHLIASLGSPCNKTCAPQDKIFSFAAARKHRGKFVAANFEGNSKACEEACRADKVQRVKGLMAKIAEIRRGNAAELAADEARRKDARKAGEEYRRIYSEIKNGTGSLEASPSTYVDSNELHCSVSARTKEVCAMCGGSEAFRFAGFRVERMAPREQRFVPQYPFRSRSDQDMVRRLLKATAPHAINTMSLAGHGAMACFSSSPPPMVFQTLLAMGVNLTSWGWERGQPRDLDARGVAVDGWRLMSGMPTVGALKSIGTSSIRVYKDGRTDLLLPAPDRRLGMAGREAGGGWVGVGTSGDGGAPAAAAADAGGGGAQGGVQVVSVMWEDTRTPWGGSTPIVHRLAIRDALGAVEVRGALPDDSGPLEGSVKEVRPYINGSMPFGGVDLAVLASQAPGSRFGSLYGSFPASGVRVGDVLQGFGCGEQGLAGGTSVTCDPLPPMPDDNWQESGSWDQVRSTLRKLGLGADSVVENARLESVFEGSAEGGKVYHVVRGVMSSWPRASVQLFATFVASRQGRRDWDGRAEDEDRMHFVWKLTALPTSGLTASALIRSVSDIIAPPEMDALYDLRSLSLVLARYALSLHEVPMPSSSSMNVAAGLSIEATLVLNYKTAVGDLLLPMFAAATGAQSDEWREIALAGPVAHDEVRLSGRCPDIALSGRSRLIDPVLHFIVRRFAAGAGEGEAGGVGELEVGFEGTLLLPLSPAESLRLPAYMALVTPGTAAARARQVAAAGGIAEAAAGEDAGGPYLDLAASLPTTIYALFGEADMHLSYVVFRFPFSGATFPHFIAEAVIALGAACSAAQLDTPGACLEGRVVASFDAEDPTENMLAGALPGGGGGGTAGGHDATGIGLTELLEFVGLRADSWQASDVQHLVTSARFPAGATVSYGLREHAFLLPTEPSSPHGPALYRVPPGFGGQGAMHVLGAGGASGSWVADLSSGNMILNAQLPRVSVGGLTLSRDGGIAGGPLLKMVASVLDRKLHAYVQGSLQLGSFESFVLLSVSDMGLSGATSGRFGAGLHVSLKLQAGYLQSHFLSQTTYHISGRVSQGGVHELNQHVPPAVGVLCGRHPQYCTDRRRGGLLGAGWFKICTVTFTDKAVPGGEGSHDLVRATVRAWVHGHMETYTEDLQLNSLEKSVLTLAQAVYSRYMGTYYRHGGVGSCADAADFAPLSLPSDAVTLPEGTIPNALQLQTALLLDNWGSLPEPEHGGAAAKAAWQARRGAVAQRRLAAAKRDWRAYRAAFDYDESLRVAADYTRRPQSYSVREPSALDAAMAPGIPATNSFQGASSGSAAQHGWASSFFAGAFRQGQGDLDAPLRGDYHYDRQRLARLKERLGAIAQHATTRAVRRFRQRAREMRKDMRHDLEVNSHAVRRFARAQERFDQARAKYQRLHTHPRDTGAARADGAGGRSRETMGRGTETAPAHTEQAKYAGSGGGDRVRRRLKRGRAGDVRVEGLQRSLESAESEKRALERLDSFASRVAQKASAIEQAKTRLAGRHQLGRLREMRRALESQVASLVKRRK